MCSSGKDAPQPRAETGFCSQVSTQQASTVPARRAVRPTLSSSTGAWRFWVIPWSLTSSHGPGIVGFRSRCGRYDHSRASETHGLERTRLSNRELAMTHDLPSMTGGNPQSPGKGLELCDQEGFVEDEAVKVSRLSTCWFCQEAHPACSGRKRRGRVLEAMFENPQPLIISLAYDGEGTERLDFCQKHSEIHLRPLLTSSEISWEWWAIAVLERPGLRGCYAETPGYRNKRRRGGAGQSSQGTRWVHRAT